MRFKRNTGGHISPDLRLAAGLELGEPNASQQAWEAALPRFTAQALSQGLPLASVPESCWAVLARGSEVTSGSCPDNTGVPHRPSVVWDWQQQLTLTSPKFLVVFSSSSNQGFPKLGPDSNSLATAPRVERKPSNRKFFSHFQRHSHQGKEVSWGEALGRPRASRSFRKL